MDKMILLPSSTAQWHALVLEAQESCSLFLDEDLQSYLVFLLMRFTEDAHLSESILALDYLQCHQQVGSQRREELKAVGDKCLLMAGLFPGRAKRRMVRISYFVDLGQSAYHSLSELDYSEQAGLFSALSSHFINLVDILLATRKLSQKEILTPLEAEELWTDSQSQIAADELHQHSNSDSPTIITSTDTSSQKKH